MKLVVKKGRTSLLVRVFIQDSSSTTGAGGAGGAARNNGTGSAGGDGGFPGGGGGGGGDRGGDRNREDFEIVTDYSDYKKTEDGYLFPMTTTRPGMGGGTMSSTIEKIEVNKPVDPKLYKPE